MPYDDREQSLQGADTTYRASVATTVGDPVVKAWLTLKATLSDADPGALQKIVSSSNVAGTGQIEDSGTLTGTAIIRFDLTAADSTGLSPQPYWFDVKVKTTSTAKGYGAGGIWKFWQNVTTTTT